MALPLADNEIFLDPITGQVLRIYLDTTHLRGDIFIKLRNIVESGGGCVTSSKEDASIWIVDPDTPHALGEGRDGATVLFAPWLLACVSHGSVLGTTEGNWCGFKVSPKNRVDTVPRKDQKGKARLDLDHWPSHLKGTAMRTPAHSLPPVEAIPLAEAPPAPPEDEWGALWADGKRNISLTEKSWMADVIEWCLAEYPGVNLAAVCDVLGSLGYHRSKDSYYIYIVRHLAWFADCSPHLTDLLLEVQLENQTEMAHHMPPPKAPPKPKAPQPPKPKPGYYYEVANSSDDDTALAVRKPFTITDKANFIRFAAGRPHGMEPMAGEVSGDVWKALEKLYPNHSHKSWRTWHQHRRDELRVEVAAYRAAHM
ncbi:hypothetical protein FS749_001031 [Ceratobasidium sp. UAMH 11750]|nr:hypothetical protein FS749_001031 [Ceratobasidium sp. UAMH 11750]